MPFFLTPGSQEEKRGQRPSILFREGARRASSSGWILGSAFVVYLLIAVLILLRLDVFLPLENSLSDRIRAGNRGQKSNRVVIVDIDEESVAAFGQWPWPRYRIAALMERILAAGAEAVGINMIFPERDRTSPRELEAYFLREQNLRIDLSTIPKQRRDHDATLAGVLSKGPFVLGFEFLFSGRSPHPTVCLGHPVNVAWINPAERGKSEDRLFQASGAVCSIDCLSSAVEASGFLNPTPDTDGTVRRSTLLIRYEDRYYPSLALATAMEALHTKQVFIHMGKHEDNVLILGKTAIPVDSKGNMALRFRGAARTLAHVSARDLLDGRRFEELKGKVVFVGTSAVGLYENLKTPFDLIYPNVEVQATVVDNILRRDFIFRPPWATVLELLASLLGVLTCLLMIWFGPLVSGAVMAVGAVGFWQGSRWLFEGQGALLSPFYPILAVTATFAIVSIVTYWHRERGERREKEAALLRLKASEKRLDSIMRNIPDIVYRLNPNGEITFINQAISHYGYDPKGLTGKRFLDLLAPEDRRWAERHINERRTGQRATADVEIRLPVREGALLPGENGVRYLLLSAEGLYSNDVPETRAFMGTQGIGRDITERRRLESQLIQAQKMESLGTLAGGIAHDFNNLLMGIQGNTSLLLMEKGPAASRIDRLKNIEEYVRKGSHLTRQLLSLGRQDPSDAKDTRLNEFLQKNLDLFQRTKKDVQVHTLFQEDVWPVRVDRGQLEQVLLNLFVNAQHAMTRGGDLTVETGNVKLGPEEVRPYGVGPGNFVRIAVRDNGTGMDEETLSRIFDPFFTTKRLGGGTGLGLSSAYGIIQKHKGIIRAESEKGVGTTFEIFLPATDTLPESEVEAHAPAAGGRETLLLVDDEDTIREVAATMLMKLGYTVHSVAGGKEALDLYARVYNEVALVILDLIMPEMSGLETFRRLKEIDPELRVLFASGYGNPQDAEQLLAEDTNGFIQKPYTLRNLSLKVRGLLDA